MFDVLFIYCTMVCVFGLPLIQTCQHRIILKTFKCKTLSSMASVLDAHCIYFLYLSMGLHASNLCQNCGNTMVRECTSTHYVLFWIVVVPASDPKDWFVELVTM
jgi:hypothetical protein